MIVVGIDPSLTNTGIAILADGHPEIITSTGIGGHDADSYCTRSRRVRAICQRVLRYIPKTATLVVIEGPSYNSRFGNPFDRAGLWHGLYGALDHRNIPIAIVAPKVLKLWATGNASAKKDQIVETVTAWWPNFQIGNNDQADALVLAAIGAHHHGLPMPFTVKPRHTTGLEAVQWPDTATAAATTNTPASS